MKHHGEDGILWLVCPCAYGKIHKIDLKNVYKILSHHALNKYQQLSIVYLHSADFNQGPHIWLVHIETEM